jgi:hypothetical protein
MDLAESPSPRAMRRVPIFAIQRQKMERRFGPHMSLDGSAYAIFRTRCREASVMTSYMFNRTSSLSILLSISNILSCKSLTEPWYLSSAIHLNFCPRFEKKPELEVPLW